MGFASRTPDSPHDFVPDDAHDARFASPAHRPAWCSFHRCSGFRTETPNLAAGGLDAHNFFPAPYDGDARDPLKVHRVGGWSGVQGFAGAVFEYAEMPMSYCADEACTEELDVLDNVFAVNISGGYAPIDRVRIFVGAPVYIDSQSDVTPGGGGFGDIRLGAQVAAFVDDGPIEQELFRGWIFQQVRMTDSWAIVGLRAARRWPDLLRQDR